MGNHLCGTLNKRKEDADGNEGRATDRKQHSVRKPPKEEVLYATIDHGDEKEQRKTNDDGEDGCDYAVINVSSAPARPAASEEDCMEDYVLMR
ncbi:hypothetical protein AAFF_G00134290 [Aldrovandia affinis]|uniref:Uncharacterized protein n=1 Tax=Aldrovandia affinis TaxID=143900 RepID=A0AAD7RQ80_9TELE|nr:hypothetical protein AAFF_G00134290 [Aldrovandia affinis]